MHILTELGRSCITFRDLGSSSKINLGSARKYFKGAGEIWTLFSESKGALASSRKCETQNIAETLGAIINQMVLFDWILMLMMLKLML